MTIFPIQIIHPRNQESQTFFFSNVKRSITNFNFMTFDQSVIVRKVIDIS